MHGASHGSKRRAAMRAGAAIMVWLAACGVRAAADADSLARFMWGATYGSQLSIVRSSAAFPWNDEESASHVGDRLSVFGELRPLPVLSFFLKCATGTRLDGAYRENRFMLSQGHAEFSIAGASLQGRFFLRERLFRTNHRLMEIVSDESPFLERKGEGIALTARAGRRARLHYIETALKNSSIEERSGGLPVFAGGGDIFRMLRIEAGGGIRAGVLISQIRSIEAGDAVMVGVDLEARRRGMSFMAELVRSQRGSWRELSDYSLFDLDIGSFDLDRPSSIFSSNDAFSIELEGFSLNAGRFGSAGVVPAYRFCGASFLDLQGELKAGTDEASVIAWWRPPRSDVLVAVDGADGSRMGVAYRMISADVRARYRGGFEVSGRLIACEGRRSSGVILLASETKLARSRLTARLDDLGERNEFACFAESSLNLTRNIAAGGALYLFESSTSRYTLRVEFRPRERFLLTVAAGSFCPGFENIDLRYSGAAPAVPENRSLVIAGRVWIGRM